MIFREVKCPICNKIFIPAELHSYKDTRGNIVCTYHCVLEAERRAEKRHALNRERRKERMNRRRADNESKED